MTPRVCMRAQVAQGLHEGLHFMWPHAYPGQTCALMQTLGVMCTCTDPRHNRSKIKLGICICDTESLRAHDA